MSEAELAAIRDGHSVAAVAEAAGARLRAHGQARVGSCPICSHKVSGSATRFEIKPGDRRWVCAVCADGGDVIRLVQVLRGCSFRDAIAHLGGAPVLDAETVRRRQAERAAQEQRDAAKNAYLKEQERLRLLELWRAGVPIAGSPVEAYLAGRALVLPRTGFLRYLAEAPYFHGQTDAGRARVIHRGPAMLASIVRFDPAAIDPDHNPRGLVFSGLHFTYLAPGGAGKASVVDPDSGEILPAKKVRGGKKGGAIPLLTPNNPRRLMWGEGIETVLSVSQDPRVVRLGDAFWAAVDLGNLGGKARATIPHPTELSPIGRPLRVPGPDPDFASPAAAIPDTIDELVILGDGDSDPFLTRQAALRCAKRYARPGRVVRAVWANAGADFNDMKRGAA